MILIPLLGVNCHAVEISPENVIKNAADELFSDVRQNKESYVKNIEPYYKLVDKVLAPILDYDSLIYQIIGKAKYKNTSNEQKERFKLALKDQLIRVYSKTILEYSDAQIIFLDSNSKTSNKIYIVYTELYIGKGKPNFKVNYAMKKTSGTWKVVEVVADGIRLVKSLKNSLSPEIQEKGLEEVINRLESESAS